MSDGENFETSLRVNGAVAWRMTLKGWTFGKSQKPDGIWYKVRKTTYEVFLPKKLKMNLIKPPEFRANFHLQKT